MNYIEPLLSLLIHICVCSGLCIVIIFMMLLVTVISPTGEKNTAYECGFKPFDFTYYPFDVQFYRVGILFLLFDVEIIYFFPWVLNFYQVMLSGHIAVLLFILLLFFGFIYEVKSEALVWYPQPWKQEKNRKY